jgi:DNA-binding NtrC family response regulator
MDTLRAAITTAARTHAKVLILGETGVGKEVVARLIQNQSPRAGRAFVAVNCSGIPETLLESELFGHRRGSFTGAYRDKRGLVRQAECGTLFLDELGEMSLRMQASLLRFAETGEIQPVGTDTPAGHVDVRLIAATNRDLRAQMAKGAFREDLYYRLSVIEIRIPPLRERRDDIMLLLAHYLERAANAHGLPMPVLTPAVAQLLVEYAWPGNVRELRNVTERLVLQAQSRPVTTDDLALEIRVCGVRRATPPSPLRETAGPLSAVPSDRTLGVVRRLRERMQAGEDFWAVVHRGYKAHEVTRADLAVLIDSGLKETRGSYRALLTVFNLPLTDYKRFHAFLYQQQCNLPISPYREPRTRQGQRDSSPTAPGATT